MLINESGLAKAIKREYKTYGYTVMRTEQQTTIYTPFWCVVCMNHALPRKALATIVEHIGTLPDENPVHVRKDEELQEVLMETVAEDMKRWTDGLYIGEAKMADVTMQGLQVFQPEGGGPCYAAIIKSLDILEEAEMKRRAAEVKAETALVWKSDDEMVALTTARKATSGWAKKWERAVWGALESVNLHREVE